jgi:hypothetical protein
MKDKEVDEKAILSLIDSLFEEDDVKKIFKTAYEDCAKEIKETMPEREKKLEAAPYNIKKDECNIKPMVWMNCILLNAYTVS